MKTIVADRPSTDEQVAHGAVGISRSLRRPRVAVVLPSDRLVDVLLNSGTLDVLRDRVDLRFIVGPDARANLLPQATVLNLPSLAGKLRSRLDTHMWYHALYRHLRRLRVPVSSSWKATQLRPFGRALHSLLAQPPLAQLVSASDTKLFFRYDAAAVECLRRMQPELVLVPGSALDSYSHMIVRSAQYLGIRSAMIISHWDYFSKKGLLRVAPDRIYIWGEDMLTSAVSRNGIDRDRLRVVGAPQFDKYWQPGNSERTHARQSLGLPQDGVLIFFAGVATPFDELQTLKQISNVLAAPEFSGCRILYRPHPRATGRRHAEVIDPRSLPNVLIDDPSTARANSADHFTTLMTAVDGVVSPYSTMILEGALRGKPAFCVAFSDGVNEWDFAEAMSADHIHAIQGRSWLTSCVDRTRLAEQFRAYVSSLVSGVDHDRIRREIMRTVYSDHRNYAQRFADQIREDFSV